MVQRPQRPGKIISDGDREVHLCGLMEVEEKLWENGGSLWDGRLGRALNFYLNEDSKPSEVDSLETITANNYHNGTIIKT